MVLGVLRLDLNTDFERIHELDNHHGTIRIFSDKKRLLLVMDGEDFIVHAAATKIVPTAENNPFEYQGQREWCHEFH